MTTLFHIGKIFQCCLLCDVNRLRFTSPRKITEIHNRYHTCDVKLLRKPARVGVMFHQPRFEELHMFVHIFIMLTIMVI